MPPEHPELAQEAWVTKEYMTDLAFYQDVRMPSWQEICDDINSGTYALVSKNRIPPQLIPFERPINMPPDRLKILTTWFRQGQQNLDEENTDKYSYVFQWREPNGEESLRLHGATNSILAYDYNSTLYFAATQKFEFTHDTYMSAPSNLPLFDEEAIELLKKYSVSFPDLRKVWKKREEYEQLHPPKTNALIDPATQRAYGGYGGVVRVLFAVILMHLSRQWAAVNVPKIKTDTPDWKSFGDDDQKQLAYLLGWLLQVLQSLIDNSLPVVRPAIMPGHRHTAWPALQVRCSGSIYFNQSVDRINTLPAAGITFMSTDSYGAPSDRFDDVIDVDQLMDDVALSPQQAEPQPAYRTSTSSSLSTLTTLQSQSEHPASIGSLKRQSTSAQVAPEIVPGTHCSSSEPSADAEPRRNALDLDVGQPSSTLPSPQPVLHPLPFPSSRLPQGLFDEPHSASTPRPRGRVSNQSAATVSFPEPSLPDLDPPESEVKSR
ncbi:hypothetical protein FRC07_003767 [Ceratobasidium sp. 392]|nr:hypothetical protein FRC07_003767 [Ceratobasidium sp. 392]